MNRVFKISVDMSQNIDDFPNIHKINESDYADLSRQLASEKYTSVNTKIVARANFNQIDHFDFISNDLNIPIFSTRFVEYLKLTEVDHIEVIPILLIDDTYLENLYKEDGAFKDSLPFLYDYVTIKFKAQLSLCNTKLSIFRKLRSKPNELGILKKPVLNIPMNGFPKLFRIKESISILFASEQVFSIVEKNNLKGFIFEEVEVSPFNV